MANYTPLESIANVRERLHTTSTNYPSDIAIKHYNRAYKKVTGKMRLLDDEYYYEQGKTNTVVWQQEYEVKTLWVEDITRVKRVFIKYSATDTYYTPVREENPAILPYWKDYYAEKQSKTDPFYYIQDNSIWVFPASTEAVTEGIMIEVITQPPSLLTTDTADKVQVPERINESIEVLMCPLAENYIGKLTVLESERVFNELVKTTLNDNINDLSERWDGFFQQDTAIQSQFR